jgi:hypothetical protein
MFLGALYRRWNKRLSKNQAIIALAHRILIIIYQVLTTGQPSRELGPTCCITSFTIPQKKPFHSPVAIPSKILAG